jgi:hypothetical protein
MRGIRWTLLVLTAASLLAWCALWVRSYWRVDCIRYPHEWLYMDNISIWLNRGRIEMAFGSNLTSPRVWGELQYESFPAIQAKTTAETETRGVAGFRIPTTQPQYSYRWYTFPFWAPAVPMALMLWWLIRPIWRDWRTPAGHCPVCGYDLRATPDRCPECGTTVTR